MPCALPEKAHILGAYSSSQSDYSADITIGLRTTVPQTYGIVAKSYSVPNIINNMCNVYIYILMLFILSLHIYIEKQTYRSVLTRRQST